ncbi:MAG: anthranilate phosphoribosyltransferase [Spirochaetes bacterium]|nr:anthranilate phosphoribosyltransferase [Spirochaetota bacterium]MBN2770320.1 anthranilate phosphoribosyltransferase [Spirochaetota bacterium]
MNTKEMLKKVYDGGVLNKIETTALFNSLFQGEVAECELAALLIAMKMRKESADEIAGAAVSMREFALSPGITGDNLFDTCGTGGDGIHSFNVSSAVAIILNSMGCSIVKHGNRSVSSLSGSADFYEALGIPINLKAEEARTYFDKTNFIFMFAPNYHPAMKYAVPVRKQLATRTLFNMLGPLTNPTRPKRQMIGIFDKAYLPVYSQAAVQIGFDHLVLYSSQDGMDEVSPFAITQVAEIKGHDIREYEIDPAPYITKEEALSIPSHYSAQQNAQLFLETVCEKKDTPLVKLLSLNSALALCVLDKASSIEEGFKMAHEQIISGNVMQSIEILRG